MIIFEKVRWMNLLSTGNSFNEVVLDKHPTTLIVGKNGHGKSTMLDALTFALFGKAFRKVNKANLINSINGKDCLVELEFRIGSRKYLIRRGINPTLFKIYIDGVEQNQDAVSRDYQRYLETNILKFNYRAFTQIVVLGSKSFIPFMKLGPQDRRAIIENLLDIQIFSSMNRVAKEDLAKAREELDDNKRNIDSTRDQITLQQRYVEDAKKNNQDQIDKINSDIVINQQRIDKLNNEEQQLLDQADQLLNTITDKDRVETKLRQFDTYEAKIDQNKSKAEREVKFYHDNDSCPTCKQGIDHEFKAGAIGAASEQITEYSKALTTLQSEKDKLNERLTDIRSILKQHQLMLTDINKVRVSRAHIEQYIKKLNGQVAELSTKKVLSDDMMQVSRDLVNKYQAYNDARKALVENKAYHEVAVNLLKDGGIKAQIIKQYLPVINKLVNKYLTTMDFFVDFQLNEEFEESIKSRHRDQFSYDSFSEGEKQKIDIALLFAWRAVAKLKNSMNTNLLILDEIFDSSLDGNGADLVLSILSSMQQGTNVFVISHRELLHDKFQAMIKFEKKGSFSEMVTDEE